ncbi:hypothetical protein FAIPA1_50149 [Frankia sp. AiPs1]|uniref:sigma factor n=1 Tax=Frankia sp. AiPa1 TaxID=573492 RepID=UPI00202B9FC1|nr:sigma factor [Frankia sp. AiPa1]MCL9759371.1 hypothetical protein [Frankia sp. AiPa1]
MTNDCPSVLTAAGFDPFLRKTYPQLVHSLRKIGGSEADAQDAAQEAMADLLCALNEGREIEHPRAYAYTGVEEDRYGNWR